MRILLASVSAVAVLLASVAAQAEIPEPSAPSLSSLLDVPEDGVGYYRKKLQARALHSKEDWAGSEKLWAQLAAEYPRDPENWTGLAEAQESLNKFGEAAESRKKAGALSGWDGSIFNGYYLAQDQFRAGDRRAALDTLKWMIFDQGGIRRGDLPEFRAYSDFKSDPEFQKLAGIVDTTGWSRERGWRFDIDFLRAEVKRVNPDYRHAPLPKQFEDAYTKLKAGVPNLSDEQIYYGMLKMLGTLGQGHTYLNVFPNDRYLPLRFYAFPEGIFIIDADAEHRSLVGARVDKIGALPIEQVWARVAEAQSIDGPMQHLWIGVSVLSQTSVLKGIGAVEDPASVPLQLRLADGNAMELSLPTTSTPPARTQADRPDKLIAPKGVEPPLFLSNLQEAHWTRDLPAQDALYVQVNNILPDPDQSLESFGDELWSALEKSGRKNLILDLRHNNGGNTLSYPNLLRTLVAFTRTAGHHLYVLIGRRTYSATGNLITDVERLADPVFVGEASSECCHIHGDPSSLTLPYSKIQGALTAVHWQLLDPFDQRREMSPEIPVQLTAKAYLAGKDPALDAVFKQIAVPKP